MAREHATIRIDMWGDDDWRALSPGAQWLYMYLLTSPTLSYVGVCDWRPRRVSLLARGFTAQMVETYADELEAARFVFRDDESEEVLVRSFLRHDGAMRNPNLWKSIGIAFAGVHSTSLKRRISVEANRLREEYPNGWKSNPWESEHLRTMLKTPSDTPTHTPSDTPSPMGSDRGSDTTTSTSTATNASHSAGEERKRETKLPKDWAPNASHLERAKKARIDVVSEAENFRLHAETHDRRAANWNAAFTTWLKKAKPGNVTPIGKPIPVDKEWLYR